MKPMRMATILVLLVLLAPAAAPAVMGGPAGSETRAAADGGLLFIENTGQWSDAARFQVWGGGQTLWLAEDAVWLTVRQGDRVTDAPGRPFTLSPDHLVTSSAQRGVSVKLSFPGANPHPTIEPFDRLATHVSYFLGNDPAGWRPDVPVWGGVRYRDLYPGVDLEVSAASGQWQWRLVAAAPSLTAAGEGWGEGITLRVEGADAVALDSAALRLTTAAGDLTLPLPAVEGTNVQPANVERVNASAFDVTASFASAGSDPHSQMPDTAGHTVQNSQSSDLIYGTFLGGSSGDEGRGIAVDEAGSAYVVGSTRSSNFPTTPGAFDTSFNGGDAFVVKLNPAGNALAYATFLGGGSGGGIAVDAAGRAYVTGGTGSSNFPTTPGAFDTSYNGGGDAFAVKLDPTGSALLYSTFLGGSSNDSGGAIAVDAAGHVSVTGRTESSDFPTTPGVFDTSFNGSGVFGDAFVVKLDPAGSALAYATFLGGSGDDYGFAIAVNAAGNAYVTGDTWGAGDFPTTPGAFDTSYNGDWDAFVVKLDPAGTALAYATLLGGTDSDHGSGIAVDGRGSAYVTGATRSDNFPTTPGAFDTSRNGGGLYSSDAFVVKLNPVGNALAYATFLGGSGGGSGCGIAVDAVGRAYVTGGTGSRNFPTTPGAFDTSYNGGYDAFLAKLDPAGSALAYATFLGGSNRDLGYGIAIDGAGGAYVTGETGSRNFPVMPGAFDTSYNDEFSDAFVAKLSTTYPPAIWGAIWHDLDGAATRDPGEPGIAGVQVCAEPLGHRAIRCATSGPDGSYTIELDAPGTYLVTPSAAPEGMRLTTPGFGLPVVVREGQQARDINFGYR